MGKRIIKKFIICLLVAAVALGSVFAVAGCNLIVENEYRTANQVLATVKGVNGIVLTVTQNEIMDYYNTYGPYLTNPNYGYNYTVEEAFEWCLENKIKSKYLITVAMVYLTNTSTPNASIQARQSVRMFPNSLTKPEDALTLAEYYAAVYSTKESIESSLESLTKQAYQDKLLTAYNKVIANGGNQNIDRIEFADETKEYLKIKDDETKKNEYYVNQGIDKNSIKVVIVYDDGSKSDAFIVPDSMYTTAIDTSSEKKDNTFVISVDEKVVDKDGNISYESHTLTYTFDVVKPRATREKEDTMPIDNIKIGDIEVSRYATKAELEQAGLNLAELEISAIDPVAKYNSLKNDLTADRDLVEAYRQLNENIKRSNKDFSYFLAQAYESAVLSALQHEVKKAALISNPVTQAQVINEFKFLYETGRSSYVDSKDRVQTFGSSITQGIESLYYYPNDIPKLSDYFFVYQMLLKFSDEQSAFLSSQVGSNKELAKQYYEVYKEQITVKKSNLNYDADFDCPYHEEGRGDCIYEGDGTCPSSPYELTGNGHDGEIVYKSYTEITTALQNDLSAIYARTDITDAEKSQEALNKFLDYVYKYNDDPGVMNTSAGYAISPEGEPDPNNGFDKDFLALCRRVYDYSGKVGNAFDADGQLAVEMTSFGAHIVMISMTPFKDGGLDNLLDDNAKVLAYLNRAINIDGDTLFDTLKKNLEEDIKTRAYNTFTDEHVKADLTEDESIVTIETKKVEKMIKKYTGK
ncbi:MAG TPA: hypothetical protein PLS05_01160 [Clostridia bacterium]|nr:hypothetical protein [Clostridia bacterium]HOL60473.1 hypothetical protein [Clostridia bacterium]HPO52880.1 hypothetical protein [Clostridia bacterium]